MRPDTLRLPLRWVVCGGGGGGANYLSRSLHTLCLLLSMSGIKQWA